jgi:hypothetical protein
VPTINSKGVAIADRDPFLFLLSFLNAGATVMVKKRKHFPALFLCLCMIGLAACARQQVGGGPSVPDWVNAGSGPCLSDHGKVLNGVGVALGPENRMLLRASADNMARRELAGVLEKFTQALFDEAAVAITDADQVDPANQSLGLLNQNNLSQSVIVDHWMDQKDGGRVYSLCQLDLTVYKENLARFTLLPQKVRSMMLDLADSQHSHAVR